MPQLSGKRVLLGVSGGIAAYKTPELVRRLKEQGADVRVVLTQGAKAFVTAMSLQAVSANPVHDNLLDPAAEAAMGHIELAKWADLIVIAPASANLLARLTHGFADDLLTTLCLASTAPIYVAPAMNQQMWAAAATQANMAQLSARGVITIGPDSGEQACGDVGAGRMVQPDAIVAFLQQPRQAAVSAANGSALAGKKVVITAGPTREAIDPVRYLSNFSSGKMGYAVAAAAQAAGATVTLVSGPVQLTTPPGVARVDVDSAEQMLQAVTRLLDEGCDIFIGCAAVADYRMAQIADNKMKKTDADELTLTLVKNPDIIAYVGQHPKRPFTVGFAAETQDLAAYAQDKLTRKNLNMIAANDVSIDGQGFNSDNNALTVYWQNGQQSLPLATKSDIATALIALIADHHNQ
ncbi:bifunctional phosphopantothenoylcysteine decarboxylase/phosphopantothenate--cysteine ligase CoaBC [Idiomarina xiamenensis]|uniref:Coenzyme A biosynthesis bifunctional protein CoaBC n=1 Tax=Idiomarina xiamenensis 10-D-4 TaxID=740709 RepID=K2JDK4_9GAMM|nr:bifunctional phosphopantothenoylcysteine decarboxylase/phosphopantothenate--cysteine ligase CoaBC [Idiomarina xiamenensis]EKE81476.1 coenzyme A biosynthesis bifunctional protein coaBc [Idiomarina xiamenensis 10-D-4]